MDIACVCVCVNGVLNVCGQAQNILKIKELTFHTPLSICVRWNSGCTVCQFVVYFFFFSFHKTTTQPYFIAFQLVPKCPLNVKNG